MRPWFAIVAAIPALAGCGGDPEAHAPKSDSEKAAAARYAQFARALANNDLPGVCRYFAPDPPHPTKYGLAADPGCGKRRRPPKPLRGLDAVLSSVTVYPDDPGA